MLFNSRSQQHILGNAAMLISSNEVNLIALHRAVIVLALLLLSYFPYLIIFEKVLYEK